MRPIAATFVLSLAIPLAGCQAPLSPAAAHGAVPTGGSQDSQAVAISATGGGHYTIPGDIELQFAFSARLLPDGRAQGTFHHQGPAEGALIQFSAEVTCLAVDSVNHRAWIGGVITENRSTHPQFTTPVHQVGHDIWFRVQDNGPGQEGTPPDVTTIVGFEGIIPSSQNYCDTRPWRDNNVWAVRGNVTVSP